MSSMLEVLVALSLFVLAFAIVLSPLQINQRSAVECSERMGALALANDLIEQERSLALDKMVPLQGQRQIYAYSLTVSRELHLRRIKLLIRWGHDKQFEYGTLIQGEEP